MPHILLLFQFLTPYFLFIFSSFNGPTTKNIDLNRNPVEGFSAGPKDDNIFEWEVVLIGPPDTL